MKNKIPIDQGFPLQCRECQLGPNKKHPNRVSHFEIFGFFKWCLQMDVVMYNYINEFIIYVII